MSSSTKNAGVVPASLSFLAIYNPSLSRSDETLHDQIVYYHSNSHDIKPSHKAGSNTENEDTREEKNERLRQIGLAQGMVEFAKSFSDGEAVDSIETEKSRIVLHELEPSWWILASIDLTRIISSSDKSTATQTSGKVEPTVEYSAREVCPPPLLLQQILRAHRVFLLHHSPTITELHGRLARPKFCSVLKAFWDTFVWNWDVLLHGNPAVDVFNGLKLAAGGELGIGVGEEEWGSGEREVLEGFIGRTDSLVDLVVSRFGDAPQEGNKQDEISTPTDAPTKTQKTRKVWQGSTQDPRPSDGVIFSGIGAISRSSVRDISSWVEMLFKYGEGAYGMRDNPSSTFRRKRKKSPSSTMKAGSNFTGENLQRQRSQPQQSPEDNASNEYQKHLNTPIGIPPPIVAPVRPHPVKASLSTKSRDNDALKKQSGIPTSGLEDQSTSSTETLMKYLTLGVYGSQWGIPLKRSIVQRQDSNQENRGADNKGQPAAASNIRSSTVQETSYGYFMIGLQGDLEQDSIGDDEESDTHIGTDPESINETRSWTNRTMRRTVHVERTSAKVVRSSGVSTSGYEEATAEAYDARLRVVVYVQQPFIFTFLFELHVVSLALPSFYRSLHHQLGPLQRPLLASTSPDKVSERLWEAAAPKSTASTPSSQPICDLVYDPSNLTVHTTIPNIPEPGLTADEAAAAPWTRVEALTVHSQILNTYMSTRRHTAELERTCKTNRGWWVVWMRLPHPSITTPSMFREAFLIRKASDYVPPAAKKPTSRFGRNVSASSANSGWGPGKLAEGIGIDARQYIEGLLSLNR